MRDENYKGTLGNWGNLVRFNSLHRRWPGATRKEIIELVFGREKEMPKGVTNGKIQMYTVREQPLLLLWRCIEEYDDGQSMLVLLSGKEREEIIRGEICDTADDIVVLENGVVLEKEYDTLFGVLDIEEMHPEYKLRPKNMTPKHSGSRADMQRIKETSEACEQINHEIAEGKHLDAQGKIVKESNDPEKLTYINLVTQHLTKLHRTNTGKLCRRSASGRGDHTTNRD